MPTFDPGATFEGEWSSNIDNFEIPIFLWSKGDILVRTAEGCGQSCGDTPLANPDLLWPSGIVEFRFYKHFPSIFQCYRMFLENNCSHRKHTIEMKKAMRYITNRTSCVTFVPATKHSPNFVTIAPGLSIFFLLESSGNLSEAIC